MGMCAEIVAIGPFRKRLIPHLEYPAGHYQSTAEGALISEVLFGIHEGTSLSREFATLLGVNDPWDFNQHHLSISKFNETALISFGKLYPDYCKSVHALLAFREEGFEFHFRPNG